MKEKNHGAGLLPSLLIMIFTAAGFWLLGGQQKTELVRRVGSSFEKGVVTEILQDNIQRDGTRVGEQRLRVHMFTGPRKGQEVETTSSAGFLFGAPCRVGMNVVVMMSVAGSTTVSSVYSRDREHTIYVFGGLYLVLLVLIGGMQGLKGALGLIFTFVNIVCFELPLIYRGYSPYAVTVTVCALSTLVTMYFIGGATRKTVAATAGTVSGIICAGLTAWCFGRASGIGGWNVSNIESLMTLWNIKGIQVGQLMFCALLISSLGAVMDVAMSIASAMQEIYSQNPALHRWQLFRSGLRVGRDMMGTDSNTLILAFCGTELSALLLNYAYDLPWLQLINSNNLGLAVMQGLGGSFGVVLSVPFTVLCGALLLRPLGADPADI